MQQTAVIAQMLCAGVPLSLAGVMDGQRRATRIISARVPSDRPTSELLHVRVGSVPNWLLVPPLVVCLAFAVLAGTWPRIAGPMIVWIIVASAVSALSRVDPIGGGDRKGILLLIAGFGPAAAAVLGIIAAIYGVRARTVSEPNYHHPLLAYAAVGLPIAFSLGLLVPSVLGPGH